MSLALGLYASSPDSGIGIGHCKTKKRRIGVTVVKDISFDCELSISNWVRITFSRSFQKVSVLNFDS